MSAPLVPTITQQWAALLHELGLGTYRPDASGGDVFLGGLPRDPAAALAVTLPGAGSPADGRNGYDEPALLVRVRGEPHDWVGAERRAQAVWDALHGLGKRVLPGGLRVERCFAVAQGPTYVTRDDQSRHEWSVQMSTELRRPSTGRR